MEELKVLQSKLKAQLPDLELREQEPMRLHTTFRVGGPASLMALPRREADLGQLLRMAFQAGVTPFFLGKGSNLLVADEGVDRFLIKLAGGLNRLERAEGTAIYVGSGVTLAQAAVFAAHHGLTGLEFAHGIPGTMGGGVFMNAGAYEGEMAQVVDWVDCLDEEGMPRRLSREALPQQHFSPAALADYRGTPDAGAGRPCGHPGENGRPVPPPPGQAAPGVSQRGKHL